MSPRTYRAQFATSWDYLASRRFERGYDGFPIILVATTDDGAEECIARVVRAAAVGRAAPLLEWGPSGGIPGAPLRRIHRPHENAGAGAL